MKSYESCNIVKYALALIKQGFEILYFNNKEDLPIVNRAKGVNIYNIFVV